MAQAEETYEKKNSCCQVYKNLFFSTTCLPALIFFLSCHQTMTDVVGNPEEERRSEYYYQPWAQEAVCRYFYTKVQQKRAELEQALGIRNGSYLSFPGY